MTLKMLDDVYYDELTDVRVLPGRPAPIEAYGLHVCVREGAHLSTGTQCVSLC